MALLNLNNIVLSVVLPLMLSNTCEAIKCFQCNSANNSACLYMHMAKMNAIIPVVDCAHEESVPKDKVDHAFCRKITQTILHGDKTPEVRITRACGWVKHNTRDCYKNDNMDHLETACQCFSDMCNAATSLAHVKVTALAIVATLLAALKSWRGNV